MLEAIPQACPLASMFDPSLDAEHHPDRLFAEAAGVQVVWFLRQIARQGGADRRLDQADIEGAECARWMLPIAQAAITRWRASGANDEALARMAGVSGDAGAAFIAAVEAARVSRAR